MAKCNIKWLSIVIIIIIVITSRPLYGGGSGVCVYFVYVYIVLWFGGLLWLALGPHFAPWGDFAPPFGSLWGALGSQGGLLGVTLDSFWLPVNAAELLLGTSGSQGELWWLWVEHGLPFPSTNGGRWCLPTDSGHQRRDNEGDTEHSHVTLQDIGNMGNHEHANRR